MILFNRVHKTYISLAVLITLVLVGCMRQSQTNHTLATEKKGLPQNIALTVTPSLRPIMIPSSSPELVTTEYPIEQLSQEEKKRVVADFLRTNNHCDLPCLMGVEFNKSKLEDIQRLFSPYLGEGLITKDQTIGGITYGTGFETTNLLRSSFKFHISQEKVDGIDFYLGGMWRPEVKIEEWMPFTLPGLLKQLGQPSQIRFYLTQSPNEESVQGVIINTVIYYEHKNMVFVYFGQRIDEAAELLYCPMQQQPEYMVMHVGTYADEDILVGVGMEDSTSLSIEDFFNLDWNETRTCILLNSDALKFSE